MTKYSSAPETPFILAITDHNTVSGCEEAVKNIIENPFEYRNLRLMPGVEITTSAQGGLPDNMHMLFYGHSFNIDEIPFLEGFFDTAKLLSSSEYGKLGIAHPARYIKPYASDNEVKDCCEYLFDGFKLNGKDKAEFVENYYQSYYGDRAKQVDIIKKTSDDKGLVSTGGLDSHSNNIFTQFKDLSDSELKALFS